MNKIIITGTVLNAPALRFTDQGDPYCHVGVKDVERGRDGKEWTTYHHVPFFGPAAEAIAHQWKEGDFVYIEGKLQYRKGGTGTQTTIRVQNYERLQEAPPPPADPELPF